METSLPVLDRVLELKASSLPDIDRAGNLYTTRNLHLVEPPLPPAVTVHTLSGLVDLIAALALKDIFIHVENPLQVSVQSQAVNSAAKRTEYITCSVVRDTNPFSFGTFYIPEEFVIALQSKFADGGDLANMLVLASNVKQEAVTLNEDDGFSQKLSASAGVHLKAATTAKPRVTLAPYRTFPEVDQPASIFLFRARGGSPTELPKLALFEADGGKWRTEAVENIARALRVLLAPQEIPIVS